MSGKKIAASSVFLGITLSAQAHADFLSDSKATLGMRNFYFNNDSRDGTAAPSKTEE
ncbi:OprD family outer membrane porin, partial [Pseudomonas sp. UBA800]